MITTARAEIIKIRNEVMERDFSRMNEMQRKAVFKTEGPLLILAGAGSGKTTVLVNRIANIVRYGNAYNSEEISPFLTDEDIEECISFLNGGEISDELRYRLSVDSCKPWKMMAITFTNKAAGELKERLSAMLGDDGSQIWALTFHATCARILRRDGDRLGFSSHFTVYDTDDSRRQMKLCLSALDISDKVITPKSVLGEISRAKDEMITPEEFEKNAGDDFRLKLIAKAYKMYQRNMEDSDAMDFDDMLVNTVRLLKNNSDVLEYYQNKFKYIMVDEYQDTNHVQYEFVSLLAKKSGNLCVVGDDDQSIYKFRGATIENIMNFEHEFKNAEVIRLEQNYRSTQNILDAANAVITNNTARKGKSLWTDNGEGTKITLYTAENEQDEAEIISKKILEGVEKGRKFSDFAILYRMNAQSLMVERMLTKQGIPHRLIGGTRFYDRKEIKDIIAYLCVINNQNDNIRLRRIINLPKRGIGNSTLEHLAQIGEQLGESMFEVLSHAEDFPVVSRAAAKLKNFHKIMSELIEIHEDEEKSINDLYEAILEKTGYIAFLKSDDPERAPDRIDNVTELSSNIQRYEEEGENPQLSELLEEIFLLSDIDNYDEDQDSTVLMTVHSAKGLEFPVVFLPGWEEGIFPGMASIYNPAEVEEERRLAYVAITRAKEELTVLHAESRMLFGSTMRNGASRFAKEMPEDLLEKERTRMFAVRMSAMPSFGSGGGVGGGLKTSSQYAAGKPMKAPYQPKPPVSAVPAGTFSAGDTVEHKTFGSGLILSTTPMANDILLEIAFDKVGTKKLFSNFARLKKL